MDNLDNIQTEIEHKPKVSIVVPTFNRAHLLPRAISSILSQTFSDFEIIIVDDASTDNTSEVVKTFKDSRIKYIPLSKNGGGGYARNQGIKAAHGELVAFLDSDDEWMPEKLELQVAKLQESQNSHVSVVYCQGYEKNATRQIISSVVVKEGDVFDDLLKGWLPPTTSLFMVKRRALIEVGGFDESLPSSQDYDLWLSLAKANHHFIGVDKPLIIRYIHGEQIGTNVSAKLKGYQIFKHKWGIIMKERVGAKAYHRYINLKESNILLSRIYNAIGEKNRMSAFRYSLALLKFLPHSGVFLLKGLMLTLFGSNIYTAILKFMFQIKSVILSKNLQNQSLVN